MIYKFEHVDCLCAVVLMVSFVLFFTPANVCWHFVLPSRVAVFPLMRLSASFESIQSHAACIVTNPLGGAQRTRSQTLAAEVLINMVAG